MINYGDGNWRVKLLTNGTLVSTQDIIIDTFLVGGGGAGFGAGAAGGTDGSNGGSSNYSGGKGQGTTTREFGLSDGMLYASGGAGGTQKNNQTFPHSNTGNGGGGGGNENYPTSGASGIIVIRNKR